MELEEIEIETNLLENFTSLLLNKNHETIVQIVTLCIKNKLISLSELNPVLHSELDPKSKRSSNEKKELERMTSDKKILKDINEKEDVVNIPLNSLVEEQFDEFCEFLRSGEVEGLSYENYLQLYQEIQEYKLLEIGKNRKKKAMKIYDQYIKNKAPMKGKIFFFTYFFFSNKN